MHKEIFNIKLPSIFSNLLGVSNITIYSYATCIVFGMFLSVLYTKWRAKKELGITNLPNSFFYLIFIMGFVGGKLFYYLENPLYFIENPELIKESFSGGFVFYGSFVTIVPYVIWYLKKHKTPVLPMLDIFAIATISVHILGRIGCFLGGCCYGKPTQTLFGVVFPDSNGVSVHPTQLYEAFLLTCILIIALVVKQKKRFNGEVFLTYAILYAFCRMFLELFRGDVRGYIIPNLLSHSQTIAIIIIIIACIYYKKLLTQNFILMKTKKIKSYLVATTVVAVLSVVAAIAIGPSCSPPSSPAATAAVCNTNLSPFKTLWNDVGSAHSTTYTISNTMDLDIHEYTFTLSANKTLCSIGYQGSANLATANTPYTIEIYNNTDATTVYSGNFVFSATAIDYHSVGGITLVAGKSYTVSRIVTNDLGDLLNTTGRVMLFGSSSNPFPATSNGMTITSSNFSSLNGATVIPNFGIPYIDLIFEM